MHYIMVMRDTRFWLVGPFDSQKSAGDWGSDLKNNPADDPRWQTIELIEPVGRVEVIPPLEPMAAK